MKHNSLLKALPLSLVATFITPTTMADVRFNGFASIYAGINLEDDVVTYGYDEDIAFKPDSVFALQASSDLGDNLSATVQFVARGNNNFDVGAEWAYLNYDINDNSSVYAGRIRMPFYVYSEFVEVGYTYSWIRPPQGVYSVPFNSYEGVGYRYNNSEDVLEYGINIQIANANDVLTLEDGVTTADFSTELITMFEATFGYNEWSGRAVYTTFGDSILAVEQLNGLSKVLIDSGLGDVGESILLNKEDIVFSGVGLTADYGSWYVTSEFARIEMPVSYQSDQDSWYISAGIRNDEMTYFVTYGEDENSPHYELVNMLPAGLPAGLVAGFTGAVEIVKEDSTTLSLGMRYDFHPSAAFKVEYTQRDDKLATDIDGEVLSFGVDLVF